MWNLHVTPVPHPASSLVDDFPTEQGHKGWQVCLHHPDLPAEVVCECILHCNEEFQLTRAMAQQMVMSGVVLR